MAISKDAVKTKFTVKFSKVNYPKTLKESLINKIAEKVKDDDDETNLDNILDAYEPVLIDAAKEIDKVRTEAKKITTQQPLVETEQEDVMTELPIDTPEYIKVMMKQLSATQKELRDMKVAQTTDSLTDTYLKDPRLKNIPDFIKEGYIPKTKEELESNIEKVTGEFTKFAQDNKINLVGEDTPGGGGGNQTTVNEKVVTTAVTDWAKGKIAQHEAAQSKVTT